MMTAPTFTLTLSPAQLLVACVLADRIMSDVECDSDALDAAIGAGWVEVSDGTIMLTPSGGYVATAVCARRAVDSAARMAVLTCPLCGKPGGFCSGGSCQIEPEL